MYMNFNSSPLSRIELWNRNKVWICSSLVLAALLFFLNKAGIYTNLVTSTVYTGIAFLVLTLIPNNLLKLQLPILKGATPLLARLTKYRRDFGIIAGLIILAHVAFVLLGAGVVTLADPININWAMIGMAIFSKQVILGFISFVIIVLMLLTSSNVIHRALGKKWKLLQSLIWLVVPLALAHFNLVTNKIDLPTLIGFGAIILLVIIEFIVYSRRPSIDEKNYYKRHAFLTALGIVIVIVVWTWMK